MLFISVASICLPYKVGGVRGVEIIPEYKKKNPYKRLDGAWRNLVYWKVPCSWKGVGTE